LPIASRQRFIGVRLKVVGSIGWEDASNTLFKRLILRAVLRDVYPMVIRLVAVPDSLDLSDFDDIFHAVLGWDSGIGYACRIQGQEFNSFQRKTDPRSSVTSDYMARRSFCTPSGRSTSGNGNSVSSICKMVQRGDKTPVCVGGETPAGRPRGGLVQSI
jgi:hypothetical protein